jgi:hypothetical protein
MPPRLTTVTPDVLKSESLLKTFTPDVYITDQRIDGVEGTRTPTRTNGCGMFFEASTFDQFALHVSRLKEECPMKTSLTKLSISSISYCVGKDGGFWALVSTRTGAALTKWQKVAQYVKSLSFFVKEASCLRVTWIEYVQRCSVLPCIGEYELKSNERFLAVRIPPPIHSLARLLVPSPPILSSREPPACS